MSDEKNKEVIPPKLIPKAPPQAPQVALQNKPPKQTVMQGIREGLTSLVKCDKVPDFGTGKLAQKLAQILAYKKAYQKTQTPTENTPVNDAVQRDTRARILAEKEAYRAALHKPRDTVSPPQLPNSSIQKAASTPDMLKIRQQKYGRAA